MSEWINVEDELPVENREVMCVIKCCSGSGLVDYLLCELKQPESVFYETWCNEPVSEYDWLVTHWQPLPEPPK